jgi:hypothetical protein
VPDHLDVAGRNPVPPSPNRGVAFDGLRVPSQVMVDKIFSVWRSKCGPSIGVLDQSAMRALGRKLALVTGIAD